MNNLTMFRLLAMNSLLLITFISFSQSGVTRVGYSTSTVGKYNSLFGYRAGDIINSGEKNSAFGYYAGAKITMGTHNTLVGGSAGAAVTFGRYNTFVGYKAGYKYNTSGNVHIGYYAGANNSSSNKLFIDNSDTSAPLIWGDFTLNDVRINGDLAITGALDIPSSLRHAGDLHTYMNFESDKVNFVTRGQRGMSILPYVVEIEDQLRHMGDTDTYMNFESDKVNFVTRGQRGMSILPYVVEIEDQLRHMGDTDTYMQFWQDNIRMVTSNAVRLDIKSNGNVGIGNTSPAYKLDVAGDIRASSGWVRVNGQNGLYFENYGGGFHMKDNTWIRTYNNKSFYHSAGIMRTDGVFQVGNGGDRFHVNASGNVGIGDASPAERLEVNGGIRSTTGILNSGNGSMQLMNGVRADDTNYEWVGFYSGNTRQGIILYDGAWSGANNSTDEFSITAQNGNKLTLNTDGDHIALMPDGSGKVGIGTLSPGSKLDVIGDIQAVGSIRTTNGSDRLLLQTSDQESYSEIQWGDDDGDRLRFFFNHHNSTDREVMTLLSSGNVGIGTTSPDYNLSLVGSLNVSKTDDETVDYFRFYHDGQANISTEEGSVRLRKATDEYLSLDQVTIGTVKETWLNSSGDDMVFRSGTGSANASSGDLRIKKDGTIETNSKLKVNGGLEFSTTPALGNEDTHVLSITSGNEIRRRSVESITPWSIRRIINGSESTYIVTCDPTVGQPCDAANSGQITINADDIVDLEGNLAIGQQGLIDNDLYAGPNVNATTGARDVLDDYIRIQEAIEISSSSTNKGLVLLDRTVGSTNFLNFFHNNGVSYFSNSTSTTPDADYFMKAGTGFAGEKNQVTFGDKVNFNSGFETSGYYSANSAVFALDTDNANNDARFEIGRGTANSADETNWYGLFRVDPNGVATFSSDIGNAQNVNRVEINGAQGSGQFSGSVMAASYTGSTLTPTEIAFRAINSANATQFSVDGAGNVSAVGSISGSRIRSSVPLITDKALTVLNETSSQEVFSVNGKGDVSLAAGNLSMMSGKINLNSGDLSMGTGKLLMTSGNLSMTSGNLSLSTGNLTVGSGNLVLGSITSDANASRNSVMVRDDATGLLMSRDARTIGPWAINSSDIYYTGKVGIGVRNTRSDVNLLLQSGLAYGILLNSSAGQEVFSVSNAGLVNGGHYNSSTLYDNGKTFTVYNKTRQKEVFMVLGNGSIQADGNLSAKDITGQGANFSGSLSASAALISGSLMIGTTSRGSHKLAVEGSIGARKVKVQASGWSDYVFKEGYDLPTLQETSDHIEKHGHLPGVPSEAEVMKDGIDLGEMDAILLKKIEELTLHQINLLSELDALKKELAEIKNTNK